jgi:hypothetical protein
MFKLKNIKNGGYILLFSIVVTSIILSITLGISYMAFRQSVFTNEVKQSAKVFYVADTTLDCLVALDNRGSFGIDSNNLPDIGPKTNCEGDSEGYIVNPPIFDYFYYLFDYDFVSESEPNGPYDTLIRVDQNVCARAEVKKFIDLSEIGPNGGKMFEHSIDVWAYNLSCEDYANHMKYSSEGDTSRFKNIVERKLNYTYQTEEL